MRMSWIFSQFRLTKQKSHDTINKVHRTISVSECAAVAQSVERRIGSAEVTGPIPVSSSIKSAPEPWFYRVPAFSFPIYALKTVLFSQISEPAPIPVHKVN